MIPEKVKIYGVDGVGGADPLVRTDGATGLSWKHGNNGEIYSDFDCCYPWSDMREVVFGNNFFIRIPKFYSKVTTNTDGTYKYQISGYRYDGFSTLFLDGEGNEIDYVLVGKYEGSGASLSYGGTPLLSRPSYGLSSNLTLADFRNCARGNQLYDIWIDAMIKQLFMIEFATTDSQSVMAGWTNSSNAAALSSGHTDLVKTSSGSGNKYKIDTSIDIHHDGLHACKYRGIENLWGNLMTFCDGIYCENEKIYVGTNPAMYMTRGVFYAGDRFTYDIAINSSHALSAEKVEPLSRMPLLSFVSEAKLGGVYRDRYFESASGSDCLVVGGPFGGGSYCGLWYNCLCAENTKGAMYGARLCYRRSVL